jgi:hypothetical protein
MVVGPSGTHVYLLRQNKDVQSAYIQCQAALHILITATPTLWSYDNLSGQLKVMQKPEHDRLAQELSFEECRELYTKDYRPDCIHIRYTAHAYRKAFPDRCNDKVENGLAQRFIYEHYAIRRDYRSKCTVLRARALDSSNAGGKFLKGQLAACEDSHICLLGEGLKAESVPVMRVSDPKVDTWTADVLVEGPKRRRLTHIWLWDQNSKRASSWVE